MRIHFPAVFRCRLGIFYGANLRNKSVIKLTLALLLIAVGYCHTVCAGQLAGTFFNVTSSGMPAQISMVICLNGKGPLSCQSYTASASNLSIKTNIPNHTYPNAGIKITTPGVTLSGCTLDANGYCLFSVSDTQAVSLQSATASCQAGTVVFTPSVTRVNNPTNGTPTATQQLTVAMSACNSQGKPIFPTAANPFHVDVYGAATGVITPASTTSSTGTVTLTYNGQAFPNNISVNAWLSDSSNNGAALGVTQILKQNAAACTLGSTHYDVPLESTLPGSLQIRADVGYTLASTSSDYKTYTIDTGSLGVIVPRRELPKNADVIGPGAVGVKYYDSSGNTYSGNYFLAPVRIKLASGAVQTQPIMVLAIDKAYCTGPTDRSCYANPPTPDLHYMGVGFNRNNTTGGDLFNSPAYNAFLHITNASNGTDVTPGYYLTPNDSFASTGLRLGIDSTSGYNLVSLSPNVAVPGDFLPQAGCYKFPGSSTPNQFCGTALLDVGIDYMFLDLPGAQWPAGTFDSNKLVPAGVGMEILMGSVSSPALQYSFNAVNGSPPPANSATPAKVQWIDDATIFFNTGRRPLYIYNYLYNGQCGSVGFKHL
jgi:hypothetical protein